MDDINDIVNDIITRVTKSEHPDTEKADIMAAVSLGMRKLVWPILLSHVPEYLLREAKENEAMTVDEYLEIIESALSNPATAKEMHDELKAALAEVDQLVTKTLS